jgi:hypothetical protein
MKNITIIDLSFILEYIISIQEIMLVKVLVVILRLGMGEKVLFPTS